MKWIFWILIFVLSATTASAAYIHGYIYDGTTYDVVNDAVVSINTEPEQVAVAINGTYTIFVPKGDYVLRAEYANESAEETVNVTEEGSYEVDLILFPRIGKGLPILEDVNVSGTELAEPNYNIYYLLIFVVIAILIIILGKIIISKKSVEKIEEKVNEIVVREKEYDIIKLIKENNGEMTQRNLAKKIPLSKAKISLMVKELVEMGVIKKAKKGRENILTLTKK